MTTPDTQSQTAADIGPAPTVPSDTAGAVPVELSAPSAPQGADPALVRPRPSSIAKPEDVEEALRDVVDPELGINVVDLGLVYGLTVDETSNIATIDMTLTSAACPLTDVIEDQIRASLYGVVEDFRLNWVWMPPWSTEKITDDGREQLQALGFNV